MGNVRADGACDEFPAADPFGTIEVQPEFEAVERALARARRHHRGTKRLRKLGQAVRQRVGQAPESPKSSLSRSPYFIGWNNHADKFPAEFDQEELGCRKAIGMVNSWSRRELLTTYLLLVLLVNGLHVWGTLGPILTRKALNGCSDNRSLFPWKEQTPWILMDTLLVMSFVIFAKVASAHSRASGMFISALFYVGGIATLALSTNATIVSIAVASAEFGRGGLLLVAEVVIADCTKLRTRPVYTWFAHCIGGASSAILRLLETTIGRSEGDTWRMITWLFFASAITVLIPVCLSLYILVRRAGEEGYYSAVRRYYSWNLCNLRTVYHNLRVIAARYDVCGISFWNCANLLLLLAIAIPPDSATTNYERYIYSVGGVLCLCGFAAWELHSSQLRIWDLKHRRSPCRTPGTSDSSYLASRPAVSIRMGNIAAVPAADNQSCHTTASAACSPTVLAVVDPSRTGLVTASELDASTRRTAVRLQNISRRRRPGQEGFRDLCCPLLSRDILSAGKLAATCTICSCSSFSYAIAYWVFQRYDPTATHLGHEPGAAWSSEVSQLIPCFYFLFGLLASLWLIRFGHTQLLVMLGMALELATGLLMFVVYFTRISTNLNVAPAVLLGGKGLVEVPLLLYSQASCASRSDITMTIGFLFTVRQSSGLAGRTFCQTLVSYFQSSRVSISPSDGVTGTYSAMNALQEDHARRVWGIATVAITFASSVGFVMAVLYLRNEIPDHGNPTGRVLQLKGGVKGNGTRPRRAPDEGEIQFPGHAPYLTPDTELQELPAPRTDIVRV